MLSTAAAATAVVVTAAAAAAASVSFLVVFFIPKIENYNDENIYSGKIKRNRISRFFLLLLSGRSLELKGKEKKRKLKLGFII